jgi:hypothetical protein
VPALRRLLDAKPMLWALQERPQLAPECRLVPHDEMTGVRNPAARDGCIHVCERRRAAIG